MGSETWINWDFIESAAWLQRSSSGYLAFRSGVTHALWLGEGLVPADGRHGGQILLSFRCLIPAVVGPFLKLEMAVICGLQAPFQLWHSIAVSSGRHQPHAATWSLTTRAQMPHVAVVTSDGVGNVLVYAVLHLLCIKPGTDPGNTILMWKMDSLGETLCLVHRDSCLSDTASHFPSISE